MSGAMRGMEEYVENLLAENGALRRKLQSKAEALLILSKELDVCRRERDQFQLMAEQLQHRHSALKKKSLTLGQSPLLSTGASNDGLEDRTKALRMEADELRQQLRDAYSDLKALRTQIDQQRAPPVIRSLADSSFPAHQKEEMVQQLEAMSIKSSQLSRDLQALLDEKEELIMQRDSLRCKVHRLNHELHQALSLPFPTSPGGPNSSETPPTSPTQTHGPKVDLDALITENAYLHERLQQAEQERELAAHSIAKYKSMLDKKRSKGAIKLGSSSTSGMVISHKQVQQLLSKGTQLPTSAAALSDMRSLCLALLEALEDKSTALNHQRKTTRVLGRRVADLERRLNAEGTDAAFPSRVLLAGYVNADVDKEVDQILAAAEQEQEREKGNNTEVASPGAKNGAKVGCEPEDEDEDCLPPQLQEMVLKALEEIRTESRNSGSPAASPK